MRPDSPGPPAGIVFRRLDTRDERELARSLAAAGPSSASPGCPGAWAWFGLWDLAPVEGVGLVGAAATRLVTPKTAELCVLAVPAALPWPGLGDRLVREVADALRAQGAEWVVARPAGGDGRRLALLRGAGFEAAGPRHPDGSAVWLSLEL